MKLTQKSIYIISYENWGPMRMSKHHYAVELGRAGNKVYFINHPDKRKVLNRGEVAVETSESTNVFVVRHRLFHPYFLKFKLQWLYDFFVFFHIKKIQRKIGAKPDIVWSFDGGNTLPLRFFEGKLKVFMPVDGPFGHEFERQSAKDSDVIISVTNDLLANYKDYNKPKLLVNHGVAEVFIRDCEDRPSGSTIRVGYSGSLLRSDLDNSCFLTLIINYPQLVFEFWGEIDSKKSNIHLPQDVGYEALKFIDTLRKFPNVVLHGPVNSEALADGLKRMDILLICYNVKNDHNNRHKVLEYLGSGNVIVSSYMSRYIADDSELIEMVKDPVSNHEMLDVFGKVVRNLDHYNCRRLRERRIAYAREYAYSKNIQKIEKFINQSFFRE